MQLFLGTAGWTVPRQHRARFPAAIQSATLSHLELYASRLPCVEINSSFHRPHRRSTWQRWAAATPASFRFAVKAPKVVTHTSGLVNTGAALLTFFDAVSGLGDKLGPILVQLPPKLSFDEGVAHEFFTTLRELHPGTVALEPRHTSWFTAPVDRLLRSFRVARVAADPPKGSELASRPGGSGDLLYWRLHGAPRTYYSAYDGPWLQAFAKDLQSSAEHIEPPEDPSRNRETWVIFDNTALAHATANAIDLEAALRQISDGTLLLPRGFGATVSAGQRGNPAPAFTGEAKEDVAPSSESIRGQGMVVP